MKTKHLHNRFKIYLIIKTEQTFNILFKIVEYH